MTLDEAKKHRLWLTLSEHERNYLTALVRNNGDRPKAIKEAYNFTTEAPFKMQLAKIQKTFAVSFLSAQLTNDPGLPADEQEHHLLMMLREAKDVRTRASVLKMYMDFKAVQAGTPTPAPSNDPLSDFEE